MIYKEANANPKRRKTNDCVVRAICNATGKQWHEVYEELCAIGYDMCDMPNSKRVYEQYLENIGWVKHRMPRHLSGRRYTLSQLADDFKRYKTNAVVSVAKHLTAIVEGDLHDTWNCGHKCVGNYYTPTDI